MVVIDGGSKKIITDITYHTLDVDFILVRRHTYNVVGITVDIARFQLRVVGIFVNCLDDTRFFCFFF